MGRLREMYSQATLVWVPLALAPSFEAQAHQESISAMMERQLREAPIMGVHVNTTWKSLGQRPELYAYATTDDIAITKLLDFRDVKIPVMVMAWKRVVEDAYARHRFGKCFRSLQTLEKKHRPRQE